MSRVGVTRLLATGAAVTASTAFRAGARSVALWMRRTPSLVQLAVGAIGSENGDHSEAALRDELIAVLRDSAEVAWLELRRGVDEFDALTRRDDDAPEPSRPFRVKP